MNKIEPSVNDHVKYAHVSRSIETMDHGELKELAQDLAKLALLMQPAAIRWAANEAAHNLGGGFGQIGWPE